MYTIFRPVCIGVCARTKKPDSRKIRVKLLDLLPNLDGAVEDVPFVIKKTINVNGVDKEVELEVGDSLEATYLNRNSHSLLAPDITYGERVILWREGDSNTYYWEVMDIDQHLRSTEHVIIAFSNTNTSDKKDKTLNLTNCYFFEFSTRDKKMRLCTNKNDGEPFAYDLILNTKAGQLSVVDSAVQVAVSDKKLLAEGLAGDRPRSMKAGSRLPPVGGEPPPLNGNRIILDSAKTRLELYNVAHSTYILDGADIHEACLGNRYVTVGVDDITTIHGSSVRKVLKTDTNTVTGKQKIIYENDVEIEYRGKVKATYELACTYHYKDTVNYTFDKAVNGAYKDIKTDVHTGLYTVDGDLKVTKSITTPKGIIDDLTTKTGSIDTLTSKTGKIDSITAKTGKIDMVTAKVVKAKVVNAPAVASPSNKL